MVASTPTAEHKASPEPCDITLLLVSEATDLYINVPSQLMWPHDPVQVPCNHSQPCRPGTVRAWGGGGTLVWC